MQKKIAIIGSGSWGTALANLIALNAKEAIIISSNLEVIKDINHNSKNDAYLPNIFLASNVSATNNISIIKQVEMIFIVVPAKHVRTVLNEIRNLSVNAPLIICSKGLEQDSLLLMSEVVEEILPQSKVAILSGPNLALEVAQNKPSATTIACLDLALANEVVNILKNPNFIPFISKDIITNQICGAAKNILAIASGIFMGKNLGENARATLITRGIVEINHLAHKKGGHKEGILSLGGIGDIFLTCNSIKSRNTSLGMELVKNKDLNDILSKRSSVAEGVYAAQSIYELAQKLEVSMPICNAIYDLIARKINIDQAIDLLLHKL
jgi:glycerol-3-phosphate dehydrogenase (NAD(P)+)